MINSKAKTGSRSELLATAMLLSHGLEVFQNSCPSGPIDLVVVNPETMESVYIDVKTRSWFKPKRDKREYLSAVKQVHPDILILNYCEEGNLFGWSPDQQIPDWVACITGVMNPRSRPLED